MRKMSLLVLVIAALLGIFSVGIVAAQDATPLVFDEYVEGELSNRAYEVKYTFEGNSGDVISIEMLPKPGTYDLDPYIILRNSEGDVLAENDDFGYPLSLIVAELPADGTYTILATRSGGSTGSSEGEYWLRVKHAVVAESGSALEATIYSDSDKDVPNLFVLRPTESGPVTITYSQTVGELFGSMEISTVDLTYGGQERIAELGNTSKVSKATLELELEGGIFYIINVSRSFSSFVFDEAEATITIGIE